MKFVRHTNMGVWGLGVVAGDDGGNLLILFEGVGYKKIARTSPVLTEVPDADIGADHPLRRREDWPKIERDGVRAQARRDLPKRFDAFVEEFLVRFPEGLNSTSCDEAERNYKWEAVELARTELEPTGLRALLDNGEHEAIIRRTRKVLAKTNLAFPNELMKFGEIPAAARADVAARVVELVAAGESTPDALENLAGSLRPHGAAKWPIVSLIPFLLAPERWPFVKPTAIERMVAATGVDVEYDPMPNARTYRLVRDLYEQVFAILTDRGLQPRDAIDVQTFLWVATGMARESDLRKGSATD